MLTKSSIADIYKLFIQNPQITTLFPGDAKALDEKWAALKSAFAIIMLTFFVTFGGIYSKKRTDRMR